MWKLVVLLLLATVSVRAEDEKPSEKGPSLVETALCYISPQPWTCIREQAGRMLHHWDVALNEKRHELMVEADEETKEKETTRGLTDEEKNQKPSEIMGAVDKTVSAIANLMTGATDVQGRESRAIKKESKDVNDFNDDDYSLIDELSKVEGNLSEEARGKNKVGQGKQDILLGQNHLAHSQFQDDVIGGFGYGAGGKGKKGKKHKKGLMKMFFLGAIVKSKIELLLKVLSFHLQLKFFAIALAGLVINLARFWIDVKKAPSKVVYIEHAQHQHHYDNEHEDWGGSSWKRQSPQAQEYPQDNFAHRLAYGSQQYPQQI